MITLLALWICAAYKTDPSDAFLVTMLLDMLLFAFLAAVLC